MAVKNEASEGLADALAEDRGRRLGSYNRKHNPGDGNRAERRMLRILAFVTVLLTLGIFVLAVGISDLAPLRRDVPFLVQVVGRGEQVVRIQPLNAVAGRMSIIAEAMTMKYVRFRHEFIPDRNIMNRRWGTSCLKGAIAADDRECAYIFKHSTKDVYRIFRERNKKQVGRMLDKKISRRVLFETSPIDKGDGVYEVRFMLRDQQEDSQGKTATIRKRKFVALLWTSFKARKTRYEERYLNPFGFIVSRYRLAAVENPGREAKQR